VENLRNALVKLAKEMSYNINLQYISLELERAIDNKLIDQFGLFKDRSKVFNVSSNLANNPTDFEKFIEVMK
jgi:predicted NACHT family NTPase